MKEILEKYLEACYNTHDVKINEKYLGYILRAMEEFGEECFKAGRQDKDMLQSVTRSLRNFIIYKYDNFEEYLKSIKDVQNNKTSEL